MIRKEVVVLPTEGNAVERIVRYMPWFTDRLCINVLTGEVPLLHSHPWDFWTLILWGGYEETLLVEGKEVTKKRWPGSILFRRHDQYHRIKAKKAVTLFFRSKPKARSTTFLVDGKPVRDMKFWITQGCAKEHIEDGYNKLIPKRIA